ncbi:hypothetical protein [Sphingomonas mollis]|uniref:Uncharacterized protein n=1 Tax=Sphingomonas mollis TaxID=2795726 RepID=A0ABS0XMW5_9SPHN|nr:hypothetical protein [Sphingomonas sp. BT553]MBJ6121378.1 hypothetical protein [Sphingomonas sp. BT553]
MALAVIKFAIIGLIIAGLIFRTKETVSLLAVGGFITLISTHPIIGFGLLGLIVLGFFIKKPKKVEQVAASPAPDPG